MQKSFSGIMVRPQDFQLIVGGSNVEMAERRKIRIPHMKATQAK